MYFPDLIELKAKLFFSPAIRVRVYRKIAAMTRHGVSVTESLSYIEERYSKNSSPVASVLAVVSERMHSGSKLHEALQGLIPAEEAMLIQSGVNSGKLHESLELSVKLIKARQQIISSMWKSL
ncbi:type II secretion system F family protein, partial [Maridesulfovibrio hydrothermalis]